MTGKALPLTRRDTRKLQFRRGTEYSSREVEASPACIYMDIPLEVMR